MQEMRIDKWLWAARFFKTRSLAQEAVTLGRVLIDGQRAKPSRDVRVGDLLKIIRGQEEFTVVIQALSAVRGPAPVAQTLYEETEESKVKRENNKALRQLAPEPSDTIRRGRPTKRDRRNIDRFKEFEL